MSRKFLDELTPDERRAYEESVRVRARAMAADFLTDYIGTEEEVRKMNKEELAKHLDVLVTACNHVVQSYKALYDNLANLDLDEYYNRDKEWN